MEQDELAAFFETAAELRVKGLVEQDASMVSLSQPPIRNLHQAPEKPEIRVVGGVAPRHSKIKKRAKNIKNLKEEEVEGVDEVDFDKRESGDHTTKAALRTGHLGPKQVAVEPKMSMFRH